MTAVERLQTNLKQSLQASGENVHSFSKVAGVSPWGVYSFLKREHHMRPRKAFISKIQHAMIAKGWMVDPSFKTRLVAAEEPLLSPIKPTYTDDDLDTLVAIASCSALPVERRKELFRTFLSK